jgi:cation transport ATPase
MIFLAALGAVTPVMGAFLHNAGAFIVLFNSARVLRQKKED